MKRIVFFSRTEIDGAITGGRKYDRLFLDATRQIPDISAENATLDISGQGCHRPPLRFFAPLAYVVRGLRHGRADLCVFNSAQFMRFTLLKAVLENFFGMKTLVIHHHFLHEEHKGLKRILYRWMEWRFLKSSSYVVAASPYIRERLNKRLPHGAMLWQIPFIREETRASRPMDGELLFIGTIEPRKGLHLLLESMRILKMSDHDFRLTVIGKTVDTQYFENLKDYMKTENLNVDFKGYIAEEEKEALLSSADIFVFPSLLEGYGMAIVEAQRYGLPTVSFDNSAMPINVRNGETGFAVPSGDTSAFAEAILKISSDRDLRGKLSAGAIRNYHTQNTPESFRKSVFDFFSKF